MSPLPNDTNLEFISLAVATTLVTYSRDYLGRLAREGKIISKQINKQWFVNRHSLLNFFEQSALEDSIKKRILSLNRKNDLEVREVYQQRVKNIKARSAYLPNLSLLVTVLIIAGGLFSGVLVQLGGQVAQSSAPLTFATIIDNLSALSSEFNNQPASAAASTLFSEFIVIETEEKIPMDGGIVLFPAGVTPKEVDAVQNLFSDEVEVVHTGTTTGLVKMSGSEKTLPFVRVPKESKP